MADKGNKEEIRDFATGMKAIQKDFGKGSIYRLGDNDKIDCEFIPLDSLKLTRIMGGGIPRGKIMEVFGWESSGKTALCSYIVGQAQKQGLLCAYIDAENSFQPKYAKVMGVDIDNLLFSQPDNGEQGFAIVDSLVDNIPNLGVIVIDSIATMTPQREIDGEMGDAVMGLQARLVGQAMRKLVKKLNNKQVTLICVNQIRQKIGVMYGSPDTTPGGNALPFYASIRLKVRKKEDILEGTKLLGIRMVVKAVKNKVACPMKEDMLDLLFDSGFDPFLETIDFGITYGLVDKSGAWYTIATGERFKGKNGLIEHYKQFPNELETLRAEVLAKIDSTKDEIDKGEEEDES